VARIGFNFHIFDSHPSGVELYFLSLLEALIKVISNDEFVVFSNNPDFLTEYVFHNPRLTIVPVKGITNRLTRIIWEHSVLPIMCQKHRLDVLHCTSYITPAWKLRVPYIVTIHDTIALDFPQWCKLSNVCYFRLAMERTTSMASGIICVSKYTTARVRHHFPRAVPKTHTVYPGIDSLFNCKLDRASQALLRTKYALPNRFLLYVGNVEPKKNIKGLVQLISAINKSGNEYKLVCVGKRTWKSQAELKRINDSNDIVSIGYVGRKHLPTIYQMADVFIFPSLCEGFGFPPLEAMACGTPVIASDQGALNETMKGAAVIINTQHIEKSRKAVESVLHDPDLQSQLKRAGINRASRFSWNQAAVETLKLYREVLNSRVG